MQWLTLTVVSRVSQLLTADIANSNTPETAWNNNLLEILNASRLHAHLIWLECFGDRIAAVKQLDLQRVLTRLFYILALNILQQESYLFLENEYMDAKQTQMIRKQLPVLCKEIRRDALALVDAFDYPDWLLRSPLGAYDGNIYTKYFATVINAPGAVAVPPYFETEIAPLTRTSKL